MKTFKLLLSVGLVTAGLASVVYAQGGMRGSGNYIRPQRRQ